MQLFSQVASPIPVLIGMVSPSVRSEDGSAGFVTPFVSSPISSDAGGSDVPSSVNEDGSDVPFEEEDTNPTLWRVVQYGCCKHTFSPVLPTPNLSQYLGSTVTRVRKQLHASINKAQNYGEQETPISAAKAKLTLAEQELIRKRMEATVLIDESGNESSWETNSASRGEGPSSRKGKGIDPGNWGAVHLDKGETDMDAQHKAFAFWNKVQKDKSKALQQAYDAQKKPFPLAPPPTPEKSSAEASRQPSAGVITPKPVVPSPLIGQTVTMPFNTSPGSTLTTPVLQSTNNPKPEKAKENKPK
ncbi:hypothetical protein EDD85DRAFT_955339 [Armillaria nabsnona]|nr:hypothetical protein EDD85DRAFT_955339 [Armillaria nabsnona]